MIGNGFNLMPDVGPRVAASEVAVSSIQYVPPFDREFIATRILISNMSASDQWLVSVGSREIMRFYILTVGNQQFNGGLANAFPKTRDIFTYHKSVYDDYLTIPVPQGQSITVYSLGGATANVTIFGADVRPGSINESMVNHYLGRRFRIPYYGYVSANVTVPGEANVDTEIKPPWIRNLMIGQPFQAGWNANILALWFESMSVNTFSGAANHVSQTHHVAITKDGQRLFSHVQSGQTSGPNATVLTVPAGNLVTPGGIPNFNAAAAAGSANTIYSSSSDVYPGFQECVEDEQSLIDPPLTIRSGDTVQFAQGITGDVTGGASYSTGLIAMLVDIYQGAV